MTSQLHKHITTLMLSYFTFASIAYAAENTSQQGELEDACEMALQGKIIWDQHGNTEWADSQIEKLCGNAQRSIQPAVCFDKLMHGGSKQPNGQPWEWYNVIDLCKQTLNAEETLGCFSRKVHSQGNSEWKKLIRKCNAVVATFPIFAQLPDKPAETVKAPVATKSGKTNQITTVNEKPKPVSDITTPTSVKNLTVKSAKKPELATPSFCEQQIQGKISWNYTGNTNWNTKNLKRLCHDAEKSDQPARCFNTTMHDSISWGQSTKWEWPNALHLCEGIQNADATINCFKQEIAEGKGLKTAIVACHEIGVAANAP